MSVRADLDEVAAAFWHFDSRINYEISGDIERMVEAENDGINTEGYFEATVERRQKLVSKHFVHHRDRIIKSKSRMHRIGEKLHVLDIDVNCRLLPSLPPILMS